MRPRQGGTASPVSPMRAGPVPGSGACWPCTSRWPAGAQPRSLATLRQPTPGLDEPQLAGAWPPPSLMVGSSPSCCAAGSCGSGSPRSGWSVSAAAGRGGAVPGTPAGRGGPGFEVPSNLLFFASILFLLLVAVQLSYEVSRLEARTRRLAEDLALLAAEVAVAASGTSAPESTARRTERGLDRHRRPVTGRARQAPADPRVRPPATRSPGSTPGRPRAPTQADTEAVNAPTDERVTLPNLPWAITEPQDDRTLPPWFRRAVILVLVLVVASRVVLWGFGELSSFWYTLFFSFFIGLAMEPVVNWLAARGIRRGVGTFIVMGGLLAGHGGVLRRVRQPAGRPAGAADPEPARPARLRRSSWVNTTVRHAVRRRPDPERVRDRRRGHRQGRGQPRASACWVSSGTAVGWVFSAVHDPVVHLLLRRRWPALPPGGRLLAAPRTGSGPSSRCGTSPPRRQAATSSPAGCWR